MAYAGSYAAAPRTDPRKGISPAAKAIASHLALLAVQQLGLAAVDTPAKMRDWLLARGASAIDTATTEQIKSLSAALWKSNDGVASEADLQALPGGAPKLCDAFASEVYDAMILRLGNGAAAQTATSLANAASIQMRQELCPSMQLLFVTKPGNPGQSSTAIGQPPKPLTSQTPQASTANPGPGATQSGGLESDMVIYLVRTGDSLWSIAAARLPASSSSAAIESAWRRIWATNRVEIGPDPDVLLPGQRLRVGPDRSH